MRSLLFALPCVALVCSACDMSLSDGGPVGNYGNHGDGGSSPSAGSDAGSGTTPKLDSSAPSSEGGGAPFDASTSADSGAPTDASTPSGSLAVYASGYGPNLSLFPLDATSGALSTPKTTASFGNSPSFLAVNRAVTHLYAVDEETSGRVGAYTIDPKSGALTFQNAVSSGGAGPPFVALDRTEAYALVANYDDGTASVLPVKSDGSLGGPSSTLQVGTNAHMIATDPSNRFAFVPCLGSDYVAQFLFDATTGTLTPNATPHVKTVAGAGPRHVAFHPNGKLVYLINEKNSTLTAYSLDGTAGTLTEIQTVSTLPSGFSGTNTGAEVWVHPSGSWVLASNRGDDSLVVFAIDASTGKMSAPTFTKSGGKTPRDFTLDPTGTFVIAANQDSGNVVPFRFDATKGTLSAAGNAMSVTMASFVGVVRLTP